MWIWIASLIVLVACFIFAWRLMISNFDLLPSDKKIQLFKNYTPSDISYHQETLRSIKLKLKSLEDQNAYYELQFSKLQERLNQMEAGGGVKASHPTNFEPDDEEDWKELYFEENEKKEKLENELDATLQQLDMLRAELDQYKNSTEEINSLKSEFDSRLNDMQSLQNKIGDLQRNLEAAAQREKELEIRLQKEMQARQQLAETESAKTSLKSENEGLRKQISEMAMKQAEVEKKLLYLHELESKVNLYEQEKSKMISDLESMLQHTKIQSQ